MTQSEHLDRQNFRTVKAWLNGCEATGLKDEKKWYFLSLSFLILKRSEYDSDRSFPRTKAAVSWSPVTKLSYLS